MKIQSAVPALSALAQPTRLAAYRLLVEAGPDGLPAGVIAGRLSLAPPTLSFHLAQLERAGLVASRRAGRSIIYSANFGRMRQLVAFLTENCCGGDVAACTAPPQPGRTETKQHETGQIASGQRRPRIRTRS
ncbi:MAG: metalloregulator ArsR/SmtB family transcription factor [Alphaproteobacteria bacterium]